MSDASSASMPDKRPKKVQVKRVKKSRAKRSEGVAATLGKNMPLLGCEEWDFRWISSKSEWDVVTDYELGRELIRQVNFNLQRDHPVVPGSVSGSELHPAWLWFVSAGRLNELMDAADKPGVPESDLARLLTVVTSSCPELARMSSLPLPALKRRKWIRSLAKKKQRKQGLCFQAQVKGPWSPDSEDDSPPRDENDLLVWDGIKVPYPCHKFILHVPVFRPLTRQQAQAEFAKWVAQSGLFVGSGRSQAPQLLQLAFYRFNQGRVGLNQSGEFAVQFEPRNAFKGCVNAESADFGGSLYRPIIRRTYGGVGVLWSKSLKVTSERLQPFIEELVLRVNFDYQDRPKTPWTGKIRWIDELCR
jgi:hypothetical protein